MLLETVLVSKGVMAGIIVGVLIILSVVGLVAYSYSQIDLQLANVEFSGVDLAPLSSSTLLSFTVNALTGNTLGAAVELIDGITLNLIFSAKNAGIFPVAVPNLTYDLSINGVFVGKAEQRLDATINPGQAIDLPVFQKIQKSSISPAIDSIVSKGGVVTIKATGIAYFKVLGMTFSVPFEKTREISIVNELEKRLPLASASSGVSQSTPSRTSTQLTLTASSTSVFEGERVTFTGRLVTLDGAGVPSATIYIKDDDPGPDDLLGTVLTSYDGRFQYHWIAEKKDLADRVVEVYAVFELASNYWNSRSAQIDVNVQARQSQASSQSQFQLTSISLQVSTTTPTRGESVSITGKLLTANGNPVIGAYVAIKDEDAGSGDDMIATVLTDSKGRYNFNWIASRMDPLDSVVEIYAVYEGSSIYGSARSPQIDVRVG